jgi:hypothetical protein
LYISRLLYIASQLYLQKDFTMSTTPSGLALHVTLFQTQLPRTAPDEEKPLLSFLLTRTLFGASDHARGMIDMDSALPLYKKGLDQRKLQT